MVSIHLRSALLLILILLTPAIAAEFTSSEVEALIAKIPATDGRILEFREEKHMRLLKDPIITEGKLWFQAPNRFRREIVKPSRTISLSNGETLWLYYPELNEAEKYDLRKTPAISQMLDAITASFDIQKLRQLFAIQGSQNSNGVVLQLSPKTSALRRNIQTLTLELSPTLQLTRSVLLMKDGSRSVTTYQNEKNRPLDPSLFEFAPPAGAKVVEPLGK